MTLPKRIIDYLTSLVRNVTLLKWLFIFEVAKVVLGVLDICMVLVAPVGLDRVPT
jgi:hypothetical protein